MWRVKRAGKRGGRWAYSLIGSLAVHAGVVGVASFHSCDRAVAPATPPTTGYLVSVETAAPSPRLPSWPPSAEASAEPARPSAGDSRRRSDRSVRRGAARRAAASPTSAPVLAVEEQAEVVASQEDGQVEIAPQEAAAPAPALGGPRGRGGGGPAMILPPVAHKTAFGRGDVGDFKGVVCFIAPGTLRIADVRRCDPVAVVYTDKFNIPGQRYDDGFPGISGRSTWFMIDYQGSFAAGKDGVYDLRLHSDDGAYLYIDGELVVENDGKHDPRSQSAKVHLTSGRHRLRLLYAQTTDWIALQLYVTKPGGWFERLFTSEL